MAAMDTTRFNELCRLCATKTTVVVGVHIFEHNGITCQLRKKIESCLPIHVNESDTLPKMVCENCLYKLNLLSEFRERSIRTERLLFDLLKQINNEKIMQNHQQQLVSIDHNMIMVPNQQIISNHHHPHHVIASELDLSQLEPRDEMIVGHEIILTHPAVDMNHHSLQNISINHHVLNTEIEAHNLSQNSILVDTSSVHELDGARFHSDNLDFQHQQLLNDQFRLQHNLHVNISDANVVSELPLTESLSNAAACKLEERDAARANNDETTNYNGLHEDHDENTMEFIKNEESNSNNSILIETNLETYCNICGKTFGNSAFEAHYETHFIKCNVCFALFANEQVLEAHRKEAHSDREEAVVTTRLKRATMPIKCDSNNGVVGDDNNSEDSGGDYADEPQEDDEDDDEEEEEGDNNVAEQQQQDAASKTQGKKKGWSPKVCAECGKIYKTNYKLNEHMRKHTGEKPYKCDSCDKEFRSKIGLAQHAAKHTGKYDYSCQICGKGFQCKSYLMVHQRVHSDVKPYPCTTCGQNFKTKQSLLDHTNRHLGVKPYMCETCGRGFITKGLCKAHQKIHTGLDNRKYSCKVCNKRFVSKSYLQTHLRIHTGEKPFMCEVCGKGFLTKVDLRIHTTMHTGEKSYVCEMCGKAFARRDALRCHRRSHTGERPYSCDLCGQTFTQFTPMAIHKRLHTGERPYACESCGKTFVSRSTMMSHAKKHLR